MDPFKRSATVDTKRSLEFQSELIEKLRNPSVNEEDINNVINYFCDVIGRSRKHITLTSKKRVSQRIYKDRFSDDPISIEKVYQFSRELSVVRPRKELIDIAFTVISILEMSRHDIMIGVVHKELTKNGEYIYIDKDFKLKDYYPQIETELTPDILFKRVSDDTTLVVEVKVTMSTDLELFYNKYKRFIGNDKMLVLNYNLSGLQQYGDTVHISLDDNDQDIKTIDDMIMICSKLRDLYRSIPEWHYFDHFQNDITGDSHFITGFKGKIYDTELHDEIINSYGPYWDDLIDHVENFSLIENESRTNELLNSSRDQASIFCMDNLGKFNSMFLKNKSESLYSRTVLNVDNLPQLQDNKAMLKYQFTKKLKPSLYIPLINSYEVGTSRQKHYSNFLKNLSIDYTHDRYSVAVSKLCSALFEEEVINEVVRVGKVKKDKSDIKTFSSKFCDLTTFVNNAFSIKNDHSKSIKESICGYEKPVHGKDISPLKTCLSYVESERLLPDLINSLSDILNNSFNNESYKHDLIGPYTRDTNSHDILLHDYLRTKFLDYLFNLHLIMKSLISLNTINSKKFRLIQTNDPNTIVIMLPNADSLAGAPIRFFSLCIVRDNQDKIITANKLLGTYHAHFKSKGNIVILSKVMSLDLSRMKILANSYAKYMQLITYYHIVSKGKINHDTHILSLLTSNLVTLASLSVTENFKNIMMVCYSTFSNPDELINDKLDCRPLNIAHIYLMSRIFSAIMESPSQREVILSSIKTSKISDSGDDIIDTGFNLSTLLTMPISKLKVNNPKELLHEAYLLFYLGNKGLHGSPQEILKLYHTPIKFQRDYKEMLKSNKCILQEVTGSDYGFSYKAMMLSSKITYAKLRNSSSDIRDSIKSGINLDSSILTNKQFISTKSMVSNTKYGSKEIDNLQDVYDMRTLEDYIKNQHIDDPEAFMSEVNSHILKLNKRKFDKSKVKANIYGEDIMISGGYNKIPNIAIRTINQFKFIVFQDFKKSFHHPCNSDMINQYSDKVFNNVLESCDKLKFKTLRDFYESNYLDKNDICIRIFYKDQRSFEDREIYTGNLACRLALFPIEKLFKSMNKLLPEEAISLAGEKKHKKMYDQRIDMIKKRKHYNKGGIYTTDILSTSADASKWSASDILQKFLIPIATNPFITKEEKWFYFYLIFKYYKKLIVLTDTAHFNSIRFHNNYSLQGVFEDLTDNYSKNYQTVTSNWLQGNLNYTSSFVHYCSAMLSQVMLDVLNAKFDMNNHMNFMVHSDDSSYDFLMMRKGQSYVDNKHIGTFIYTLLQWSTQMHCIRINRKKTYISNFYKEFLSTLIVGDELFYFYLSDLLPISSDVTYDSPVDDLASFSGYINNAFTHACPIDLLKTSILAINHLTLTTYNLNHSSPRSPYNYFLDCSEPKFKNIPMQIMPGYKIPIKYAGLVPYYCGDAMNIIERIINTLSITYIASDEKSFTEIFDSKVIEDYLNSEKDQTYINYIKACILTVNDSYLSKNNDDPYTLTDVDNARRSLIDMLPVRKESKLKRSYTYDLYNSDINYYKTMNILNPMWSIANPNHHDDLKCRLVSNYSNKKFVDSLIYSRPQHDYARRIIFSNAKVYDYKLSDNDDLMKITDIYKKFENDALSINLSPNLLMNYLDLNLFTDKKIASALHVFYSKKEYMSIARDTSSYRIIIPKSIYPPEFGKHSITTIIRELMVDNDSKDINSIDPKCETFINIAESNLLGLDIKKYECPEDIDDDFRRYCSAKYKTEIYESCLVPPQHVDHQFNMRIYNVKVAFQGVCIRYFNDTMVHNLFKVDYPTPRNLILTLNAYMKRDVVSSKIYLGTKKTNDISEYIMDRFGMYSNNYAIIKYKMTHRLVMNHEKLFYKHSVNRKVDEEVLFLNYLSSRIDSDTWDAIRSTCRLNGNLINDTLSCYSHKILDLNKMLFMYQNKYVSTLDIINSLSETSYVVNYWPVPSNDGNYTEAIYMKNGHLLKVSMMKFNQKRSFHMTLLSPNRRNRSCRVNRSSIINSMLNKFRTDFKSYLADAITLSRRDETDNSVYISGLNVTMSYDPSNRLLCNIRNIYYTDIQVISDVDENDRIINTIRFIRSFQGTTTYSLDFLFKNRSYINIDVVYHNLIDLRDSPFYDEICLDLKLHNRIPDFLGNELMYLNPETIIAMLDNDPERSLMKHTNLKDESIAKIYGLYLHTSSLQSRDQFTEVVNHLAECLCNFSLMIYDDVNPISMEEFSKKIIQIRVDSAIHVKIMDNFTLENPPYTHLMQNVIHSTFNYPHETIVLMLYYLFKCYYIPSGDDDLF